MSDKTKRIIALRDENARLKEQIESLKMLLDKQANTNNDHNVSKTELKKQHRAYVDMVDNAIRKLEQWGREYPEIEIKLDLAAYLFRTEIGHSLEGEIERERKQKLERRINKLRQKLLNKREQEENG